MSLAIYVIVWKGRREEGKCRDRDTRHGFQLSKRSADIFVCTTRIVWMTGTHDDDILVLDPSMV